jgi:hypothetical protein
MCKRLNELRLRSVPALQMHEAGHVGDLEPMHKSLIP